MFCTAWAPVSSQIMGLIVEYSLRFNTILCSRTVSDLSVLIKALFVLAWIDMVDWPSTFQNMLYLFDNSNTHLIY